MHSRQKKSKQWKVQEKGFMLIEALVLLFIFSVVTVTFYATWSLGTKHIIESKNRLGAVSLANQKMEVIRNLAYADVGVSGGIPNGPIDSDEYETVNTRNFHIITDIKYVDDTYDNTVPDTIPTDYKVARVTVKWGEETADQQVYLVSNFVPPGMEQAAGGGTLAINAVDTGGVSVPSVNVRLVNNSKGVNLNTITDSGGHVIFPGTPEDQFNNYTITLSKNGYETVTTMAPFPTTTYIPIEVNASVFAGGLTQQDIIIDKLSDLEIDTIDPNGNALPAVDFNLTGGKVLGNDSATGDPVYNYDQDSVSDADGKENISAISPGDYQFKLVGAAATNYKLFKMDVGNDTDASKIYLASGVATVVNALLADKNVSSLIVLVKDNNGAVVPGATVRLKNDTRAYDVTLTTDKYGQVYFPDAAGGVLYNDSYDLKITATGLQDDERTISIGNNLLEENINLVL